MDDEKTIFSSRLNQCFLNKGVSSREVAERLDVSTQAVQKWRTGISYPSCDYIPLLAKYFNVSTDYLFGLTDTPSTDTSYQAVSRYTGLSIGAINTIRRIYFRYPKGSYLHSYIEPLGFEIESIYQKPIEAINYILDNYYFVEELCVYLLSPRVRRIEGESYDGDLTFELLHSLMNDLQKMRETFQRSLGTKLRDIYDEYTDTYIDGFDEPNDVKDELDDFDDDDIEF